MDLETKVKIREIAKTFNMRVVFSNVMGRFPAGIAYMRKGLVQISNKMNNTEALQVLFHEIGHIYCYRRRIFPAYHTERTRATRLQRLALVRTALRAERWVDEWGRKEYFRWFPDGGKWQKSYNCKKEVKWLKNYWKPYL